MGNVVRAMTPSEVPNRHSILLKTKAEKLIRRHGSMEPVDLLRVMIDVEFAGRIAVVTSFGAESAVLLHLVSQISLATPIIFLETGKHFSETLIYQKQLTEHLGLVDVREQRPDQTEISRKDPSGELCQENPDQCCHIRKVVPLERALQPFDAWITGRKRFQSQGRAGLDMIESDETHIKINPLALWNAARVAEYFREHNLPKHPLVDNGYPSIGCAPCTRAVEKGEALRAGRWSESEKTECGIHKVIEES